MLRGGLRRVPFAVILGVLPIATLAWMGCGDDANTGTSALAKADPGGTWGAEVNVTVVGLGRVTSNVPGIDCPTAACFSKFIFASNSADGANGGTVLQASPTPGAKFLGWSFEPATVGASGHGPDNCNPLQRTAVVPSVDTSATSVTLPFGETDGKPPAGQEAVCAGNTKVPLAYKVTATFSSTATPPDAESDGGSSEIIYRGQAGDISARDFGLVGAGSSPIAYWHSGTNTVDVGFTPTSFAPQSADNPSNPAVTIQLWQVTPNGVVFTDNGGGVYAVQSGSVNTVGSSGSSCSAVWMDADQNVYCRTFSSILVFKNQGFTWGAPTTLYSGVGSGNGIVVESSAGPIYYGTTSAIVSVPVGGNDGGAPSPATIVSASSPSHITPSATGFAWTELGAGGFTSTSKSVGAFRNTINAVRGNVRSISYDPTTGTYVFTSDQGIYLVIQSATTGTAFKTGTSFTSAAAGVTYLFWTQQNDANVYRTIWMGL